MKWVSKAELFGLPFVGWMMRLAGDIPVDRRNPRSGAKMLLHAARVLHQKCSVMVFPEGTRSTDGRVGPFSDGAFHLAVRAQVPVLPIVVDGSRDCLPKKSWRFSDAHDIRLKVLPPVSTAGMTTDDVEQLRESVRNQIVGQLASWRKSSGHGEPLGG
jgi:1-acyl-sn-glycerol-3-phosphate acyltransferase